MRYRAFAGFALAPLLLFAIALGDWPQWGNNPQHQGAATVAAQPPTSILADVVYDPFTAAEAAEGGGGLLIHYAVPLIDDSGIYLESKSGAYVSCVPPGSGQPAPCGSDAWNSQIWNVKKLARRQGVLTEAWSFASDWKPEPNAGSLGGWEPVFQPVLAGGFVYVPGFGGSVFRLAPETGTVLARVDPFGALDAGTFVAGGLAADSGGNVYYNAIRLDSADPWGSDARGAWLVKISASGSSVLARFSTLVAGAPTAGDACERSFSAADLPWPPSATALPPTSPCGSQRPGLNVVPAIAPDGTIYTVSRAHLNGRYGFLVAVRSDLTPLWAASLRGFLNDGCDVLLPASGTPGGCRAGALPGVDPATNGWPAGRVADQGTSSPVVLPDGAILFGALTSYNFQRGHLLKFSAAGEPVAAYDFGWDITPAVFTHGGTYSILTKDNHYGLGSYCGDPRFCPAEKDRYDITSLDADLEPEWHFTSSNTESCARQPDGSVACISDHPNGFEWCVNQPAVDRDGVVYANSEDGFLYAIGRDGNLRAKIFLDLALGAAYTPLSIGANGLIYSQNNGHLFAVGNPSRAPQLPPRPGQARNLSFR